MTTLTSVPSIATDALYVAPERRIAPFRVYAYTAEHVRHQVGNAPTLAAAQRRADDAATGVKPPRWCGRRGPAPDYVKLAVVDECGVTRATVVARKAS